MKTPSEMIPELEEPVDLEQLGRGIEEAASLATALYLARQASFVSPPERTVSDSATEPRERA